MNTNKIGACMGLAISIWAFGCLCGAEFARTRVKAHERPVNEKQARTPADMPSKPRSGLKSPVVAAQSVSMDNLLDAIEQVESGGNCKAVGDGGNAVGAYQLWKIYVDDANRIVGENRWTYDDRWDRAKSREMTRIVISHYGKGDIEKMARIHNGGGSGWKKPATLPYWEKVKKQLEKTH